MKMLYFFYRNFISDIYRRPRRVLSMIATLFVCGFVTLTAVPILNGLSAFYTENRSNVYEMKVRPGVRTSNIRDRLNQFLETYPDTDISVYSPCANTSCSYLIGRNEQDGMDIVGKPMKGNLSDTSRNVWLGTGFWDVHHMLYFSQTTILIDGQAFNVAGFTSPDVHESIDGHVDAATVAITDMRGAPLPTYRMDGSVFDNTPDASGDEADDYEAIHSGYGNDWACSNFSLVVPLATQLSMDIPITDLTLFLSKPPNDADHSQILGLMSDYLSEIPSMPHQAWQVGISQLLGLITLLAIGLCLAQLISAVHSDLEDRWSCLYAHHVIGCGELRLISMLFVEMVLWQIIGFALCIYPSMAVIELATLYANPRISILTRDIFGVWAGNLLVISAWYLSVVIFKLKKMHREKGVRV